MWWGRGGWVANLNRVKLSCCRDGVGLGCDNNKQDLNWAKLSSSFASYSSKPNKVDPLQYLTIYVKIMCMNYILLLYYKMNKLF